MERTFAFLRDFDELQFIYLLSNVIIINGFIVVVALVFLDAEYGRYFTSNSTKRYGFGVSARVAWFVQEFPAFLLPCVLLVYARKDIIGFTPNLLLLALYLVHYIQRSLIYPWIIRGGKPTPVFLAFLAFVFCNVNGYIQGRYLTKFGHYDISWLTNPCFVFGAILFVTGMAINIHSDHILRNLRKPGETGYKVPMGGLFNYVSGANFFGEIVEWSGFAIACCSFPSFAFAVFTACNIGPRALKHHRWYLEKFEDYPKSRKALIPFVF